MSRLMVVEDEVIVAADIAHSLEAMGHTVTGMASSAAECFEYVAREIPDLVLMDIHIDGEHDGIQTAHLLRERFGVPVLYLTAYADADTLNRAKLSAPLGYVVKPYRKSELRAAVEVSLYRHELERQLGAQQRWLATTLSAIEECVIAVDAQCRIELLNAAARHLLAVELEDVRGCNFFDVVEFVGKSRYRSDVERALLRRERFRLPHDLQLMLDGRTLSVEGRVTPIVDDEGREWGCVVVFDDVTEKRKEQERAVHAERLASLGTLTAGVGHEINNPLTYILGNTSLAQLELELLQQCLAECALPKSLELALEEHCRTLASLLTEVEDGADRIAQIVKDLRGFSKPDQGDTCDVNAAIEWALRLSGGLLQARASVRTELASVPLVVGDRTRMGQVFLNLIVNAAHAMDEPREGGNEIFISTVLDGDAVEAVVQDTGRGMSEEELSRAFDPFFTTKLNSGGTGLGLYICRTILHHLGAELNVESEPGVGTRFTVRLPLADEETES